MQIFYTDHFVLPLPPEHRFPMVKYRLLRERVEQSAWRMRHELQVPAAATDAQLTLAHDTQYVARVVQGRLDASEIRRIGFPWTLAMVERSRRATGATIAGLQAALRDGAAVSLAGGTHHACTAHGEGYCVFNDSVVAAHVLRQAGLLRRVLVVDLDVHQGNGTAEMMQNHEWCYTFSMHGAKNYPFRKVSGDCDIALADGTEDDEYLSILAPGLEHVVHMSRPDAVIYVSGADAYAGDRLGRLKLSKQGLRERDRLVCAMTQRYGLPIMVTMAGGYGYNVEDTVDIHYHTVMTVLGEDSCA